MIIETAKKLPCLLLPVEGKTLLLPTAAIAEIISYKTSEVEILSDVPVWFIGMLSWRGVQVPLTSLEKMESYLTWNGIVEKEPESNKPSYIAIVNRITKINSNIEVQKFRQYPFFSISLRGRPKLVRVSEETLKYDNKSKTTDARFLIEVQVEKDITVIPNLDNVWEVIDTLPSRLQWLGKIVRRGGGSR